MGPKLSSIAPASVARTSSSGAVVSADRAERVAALLAELRDAMSVALDDGAVTSGLSRGEVEALRALASSGPMRVGELRRFVPGAQSTTSELVARLEKRGLVRREVDPFDARATRVALRPRGQRLLDDCARGNPPACDELLRALAPEDRARFEDALAVVVSLARRALPSAELGVDEVTDGNRGETP